jgi:hypothetical protein
MTDEILNNLLTRSIPRLDLDLLRPDSLSKRVKFAEIYFPDAHQAQGGTEIFSLVVIKRLNRGVSEIAFEFFSFALIAR